MKVKTKENLEIKQGTTILTAKPFVYVLKSKLRSERCDNCFKRKKLLKCSGCQYVYYCDRECQKESWVDHKTECRNLRRVSPRVVPDAARILARIIFKLKRGGDQEKGYYTQSSFRKFKDLMSHYSDLKLDQKRMEHFTSLCAVLIEYIGEDMLPNSAELMGIFGRMCVNGFNILDPEMQSIGTGIYLAASVIDHSCDPNAVAIFYGTTIQIRAVKTLPALDWTKIYISYIDMLNTSTDRQQELQAMYYFLCHCSRCEEMPSFQLMSCQNSHCLEAVPVTQHDMDNLPVCQKCGHNIKAETLKQYKEVLELSQHHLQSMVNITYLDVCKVCLQKQEGLFYSLDLVHVKILDLAFESSIEMSQWEQARDLGRELVPGYKKYYGDFHPLLGILYLKLGKINLYLQNYEQSARCLKEGEKVIKVTHGCDHELYRSELIPLLHQCHDESNFHG